MSQFSLSIGGILVSLLGFALDKLGVKYAPGDLTAIVNVLLQVGGLLVAWVGRWRKGDITWWGKRTGK